MGRTNVSLPSSVKWTGDCRDVESSSKRRPAEQARPGGRLNT